MNKQAPCLNILMTPISLPRRNQGKIHTSALFQLRLLPATHLFKRPLRYHYPSARLCTQISHRQVGYTRVSAPNLGDPMSLPLHALPSSNHRLSIRYLSSLVRLLRRRQTHHLQKYAYLSRNINYSAPTQVTDTLTRLIGYQLRK